MCKILSIVVTYNGVRNNWIYNCLNSLIKSSVYSDILVIDNASTDNTVDFIKDKFPTVELVSYSNNLGFGKANNIGLKKCLNKNYDYAFLLNQDAWVEKNTIEKLVQVSSKNKDYGVISPIHLNGEGNALDFNFSNYITPNNCKVFFSDIFLNKQKEIYEIKFVNAAVWLVTKECIEKVGGFSPIFYHYGEDENYCQRVLWHKLKIGVTPNCRIYHDRENRAEDFFIENKWNKIIRSFTLYYSNPFNKKGVIFLYTTLLKITVKNPVFFKYFIKYLLTFNCISFTRNKDLSIKEKAFLY